VRSIARTAILRFIQENSPGERHRAETQRIARKATAAAARENTRICCPEIAWRREAQAFIVARLYDRGIGGQILQRIAFAIVTLALMTTGMTALDGRGAVASDDDGDAKSACQNLGEMMREHRFDEMDAFIGVASDQRIKTNGSSDAISYLKAWLSNASEIEGPNFLAEKNYADALHRAWFLMLKDGIPLYMECESIRVSGKWGLSHFDFETDRDKIPLP
jgi:hypothetical protein